MTGQRIMRDVRRQLFGHLQRLHVGHFDRNPVGRLMTRVTTDVDAINELFTSGIVTVFGDLFTLFGIMGVMLALDWRLALVTFSVIPLFFVVTNWFRQGARQAFRETRRWVARINAFLQENLSGMSVVQLFRREERNRAAFAAVNRKHYEANLSAIFYYAVFYPAIEFLAVLAVALILLYGGGQVLVGGLTLGVLVAFIQYSQRFWRPISDLSEKFNILQAAMAAAERIFGLLDTEAQVVEPPGRRRAARPQGRVGFEGVWFSYAAAAAAGTPEASGGRCPDDDPAWVLRDIDFTVEPGQSVALVGATGAGKTSIISLLMRFYDVQRGRVTLDGVDVRDYDLQALRSSSALVLQDVHLSQRHHRLEHPPRLGHLRRARPGGGGGGARPPVHRGAARTATTPRCGSGGRPSRWDRSSCSRSPGRWPTTRGCSSSTRRRRRWTPRPSSSSRTRSRCCSGADGDRHRPPALDGAVRRPDRGDAQGPSPRARDPPGAPGEARDVLDALRAPVQGPGAGRGHGVGPALTRSGPWAEELPGQGGEGAHAEGEGVLVHVEGRGVVDRGDALRVVPGAELEVEVGRLLAVEGEVLGHHQGLHVEDPFGAKDPLESGTGHPGEGGVVDGGGVPLVEEAQGGGGAVGVGDPLHRAGHALLDRRPHRRVVGAEGAVHHHLAGDDVEAGPALDAPDGQDAGLPAVDLAGDDELQGLDDLRRHRDRVEPLVGLGAVDAAPPRR